MWYVIIFAITLSGSPQMMIVDKHYYGLKECNKQAYIAKEHLDAKMSFVYSGCAYLDGRNV